MYRLKYVELPASLNSTGDYSMQNAYSLQYIRFRGIAPRISIGWSTWLYVMNTGGAAYNGLPLRHQKYNASQHAPHTMQTYVMFHPNTVAWAAEVGGYYSDDGSRDDHQAHHVPLPLNPAYAAEGDPVYDSYLDGLRGADLIAYDDKVRGQSSVVISASDLPASVEGKKVTSVVGGVEGVITGGSVSFTINTPAADQLKPMNGQTLQAVTGYYNYADPAKNLNPAALGKDNPYAFIRHQDKTDWTVNGYSGTYGEPVWWPNDVKFAVLDLNVEGGGNLARWGKGRYNRGFETVEGVYGPQPQREEVRAVRYVYVDKDVAVFRTRRGRPGEQGGGAMGYVEMSLKQGWNQIEAIEVIEYSADLAKPARYLWAPVNVWVSGAVTVDNSGGIPDLKETAVVDGANISRDANIPFKTMPWVYREQDDFHGIISPTYANTSGAPHRMP
jgi:hypothetical protein